MSALGKKVLFIVTTLLLLTSLIQHPVHVYGDITSVSWGGYQYSGFDSFYKTSIYGYVENGYGYVLVTIRNNLPRDINLTSLKLVFEWGGQFIAKGLPEVLKPGFTKTYIIVFKLPSSTEVSNLRPYSCVIEANYIDIATNTSDVWTYYCGYNIVVLSRQQLDYYTYRSEYQRYVSTYPISGFKSVNALDLVYKATISASAGDYYYSVGNFSGAVDMYLKALELYKQAIILEYMYKNMLQELELNTTRNQAKLVEANIASIYNQMDINKTLAEAELIKANALLKTAEAEIIKANATLKTAEAELVKANASLKTADAEYAKAVSQQYYGLAVVLLSVGFIIISIGIAGYLIKKPK